MSVLGWEAPVRKPRGVVALPVAAGGMSMLLARPWLEANGATPATLGLLMLALGVVSVASSASGGPPIGTRDSSLSTAEGTAEATTEAVLPTAAVLAVGMGAVAVARLMSGPVPPVVDAFGSLALNVIAAVAEEAFFRRFLYGRLLPFGAPAAVVLSGLVFALVHVPVYGGAVFWVDLGAGLLFGWQRWASGCWTAPAATHAAANLLAVLR